MAKKLDLLGKRFGFLIALQEHDERKCGRIQWICKCDCGNITVVPASALKSGNTRSCGCLHKKQLSARNMKHGLSGNPIYQTWKRMKARCYNKNEVGYKWYGARGIYIDKKWLNDPVAFFNWSIQNGWKSGKCIDRIDNNGPYSPQNCRWVTNEINCQNRRDTQLIPQMAWFIRGIHIPGIVTYKMISEAFGVSYGVVANAILYRSWKNV